MGRLTLGGIVLVTSFVAAASPGARSATGIEIGVKGLANANASIAASGSFVGIAWAARTSDGATDIYAATSRDAGRSFRAPVRVNQIPAAASVSGEQPPRIAVISAGAGDLWRGGDVDREGALRNPAGDRALERWRPIVRCGRPGSGERCGRKSRLGVDGGQPEG